MNVRAAIIAVFLIPLFAYQPVANAQQPANGSICVLAFNDANRNRARDPGESILADVNVDLMINQNVIIANHVTDGKEPFCFPDLSPQQYILSFTSPLYDATTLNAFTFALGPGESRPQEFGAVSKTAATGDVLPANGLNIQMSRGARLAISAVGAVIAMVFMIAVGMIFYSLFIRPRRGKARPAAFTDRAEDQAG